MYGWYYPSRLSMQMESVYTFILERSGALYQSIRAISRYCGQLFIPQMKKAFYIANMHEM